jgi:penicillin-binding protein 2
MRLHHRHNIKDHIRETNIYNSRTLVVFILVLTALITLGARTAYLQIYMHDDLQTLSNQNRIKLTPLAPNRGVIYDRNGVILAENRPVLSLKIIPEKVKNLEQTLTELQQILPQIDDEQIERFNENRKQHRQFEQVTLLSDLDESSRAQFAVNQYRFPGVSIEAELIRHYPFGEELVHALGYVGRINERELARVDPVNYRATRHIGKVGIEKFYEDILHGTIGYQEVETDVQGRVVRVLRQQAPVPGVDLHLAIDSQLQREAMRLLEGKRGVVIAMDPNTGSVLSMVSMPSYDPNAFVQGISSKAYNKLLNSPDRPLFNRAIRGQYSPGSTIKPMLGLLAMEQGVIIPSKKIWDQGYFQLEGNERKYRDWKKEGHGWVDLADAIVHSCDTYFYDMALKLGIDKIQPAMESFGFGTLTNIDMGEEVPALMPSRQWKRTERDMPWFPGETVIIGIGQGYWNVTPIQLTQAVAVMANSGEHYQPRMVEAVTEQEQTESMPIVNAEPIFDFKPSNMEYIRRAMKGVNTYGGTAFEAFKGAPFTSAGKSGTVQLASIAQDEEYDEEKVDERLRDNALFVAFAPYDKPKIVVTVLVENAGGGSSQAAPIARQLMEFYLTKEASDVRVSAQLNP